MAEKTSKKNLFIAVEGVDGSGKSTLVDYLARELKNVCIYSCPPMQLLPLKPLMNEAPAEMRYQYFLLGNYVGGKEIEMMLPHQHVICVRYVHSTVAYHSVLLERELEVPEGIVMPDFIVHTNADLRVIDKRLGERGDARTPYEGKDFLAKVQTAYDNLFWGKQNVLGADTTRTKPHVLAKRIIKEMMPRL